MAPPESADEVAVAEAVALPSPGGLLAVDEADTAPGLAPFGEEVVVAETVDDPVGTGMLVVEARLARLASAAAKLASSVWL
jgi:hypothetical protein